MQNAHTSPVVDEQEKILRSARRVLKIESDAIEALNSRLGNDFVDVVECIDRCEGHLIITGIGKSGLIGTKIAATFSSIGIPALFLHAAEGSHGDLGMISPRDVVMAISNSGETGEILDLLPTIQRRNAKLICITGNLNSTLAQRSDHVLDASVREEACSMNLVPTASTTVTLALGDALAVTLLEKKGFKEEDYALNHPGGSLGRKLLSTVGDLMHTGDALPLVRGDSPIHEVISEMSRKGFGTTTVLDGNDRLLGIVTDGDLRRMIESKKDITQLRASEVMTASPKTIGKDTMAARAVQVMEEHKITSLVVSSDGSTVQGIIHLHDLLKAGIV